jgi:hypothetical protein
MARRARQATLGEREFWHIPRAQEQRPLRVYGRHLAVALGTRYRTVRTFQLEREGAMARDVDRRGLKSRRRVAVQAGLSDRGRRSSESTGMGVDVTGRTRARESKRHLGAA